MNLKDKRQQEFEEYQKESHIKKNIPFKNIISVKDSQNIIIGWITYNDLNE